MQLNITESERAYLVEVIEGNYTELRVEINRTDTLDYKQMLRDKLQMVEALREKLKSEIL